MAVLRCRARGVPGVELSWTKDGTALDPEEPRYGGVGLGAWGRAWGKRRDMDKGGACGRGGV